MRTREPQEGMSSRAGTDQADRRDFEAHLGVSPKISRTSAHGLMRDSSRGSRRRRRTKRAGGGRARWLLPRLPGTYPGEDERPSLRAHGSRREPSSMRAVRNRIETCRRLRGRALRLPNVLRTLRGFLGRAAEAPEVAVEVRRASACARFDGSRHREEAARNPRDGEQPGRLGCLRRVWSKASEPSTRQRRNRPGLGSRRFRDRGSGPSIARGRCTRRKTSKGHETPRKAGYAHWVRTGRDGRAG